MLEALQTVLAPNLCDRVVALAVQINGGDPVPEEAERTRDFVEGPLRYALERLVDEQTSEFVFDQLSPLLVMAGSDVREKSDDGVSKVITEPPPPTELVVEVLFATVDPNAIDSLRTLIPPAVPVTPATDVFEVVALIDVNPGRKVVVLDARQAAVDPRMLMSLFPRAPANCTFVIWGAEEQLRLHLGATHPGAEQWVYCAGEPDQLAAALSPLLE